MGLLPMEADILPPSDDRVFKLILTALEAKPALMDLIAAIIKRPVIDLEMQASRIQEDAGGEHKNLRERSMSIRFPCDMMRTMSCCPMQFK